MALDDAPNKLESVWIQRNPLNQFYEQINVSGSDLIVYHSSSGELQADKISVWADKYGLGGASSGTTVKVSATDTTAGYLVDKVIAGPNITINQDNVGGYETLSITGSAGGGSGDFASGSLFASASLFASSSLFASASLSASWASSSISSSRSQTTSLAFSISVTDDQSDVNFNIPFVTTGNSNVFIDDGGFTYNAFTNKLSVGDITATRLTGSLLGTASFAVSSSYATSSGWADTAGSASSAFVAGTVTVYPQASGQWHIGLLATNAGVVNVYSDGNGDALWDASTKALIAPAITSSLYGTASFAVSASYAATSSLVTNGQSYVVPFEDNINVVAGNGPVFTFGAEAGSYNFSNIPISASLFFGDLQGTASQAISASYAPSSAGGGLETGSTYPITASWAESASNAVLSLFSETADYALDSQFSLSASYAISTSYVQYNEVLQLSSSYASSSLSASYAKTASYVVGGYTTPTFDQTASTWQVISGSPGVDIYNTKTIQGESQQVIRRNWRANNSSMSLWVKSPPNPPYSIVLGFEPASIRTGVNYTKCGILLYDSSSKKIVTNCLQFNNQWQVAFLKYTSPQTYNSGYTQDSLTDSRSYCPPILLAVTDDGTNLTSSYSLDGGSFWFQTYTVSRTDFLTTGPNQIGILIDSPMALVASGDYTIFHYTESAPINFVNLR